MKFILSLLFILVAMNIAFSQSQSSIQGNIIDKNSGYPIVGASVIVLNTDPVIGSITDENGSYIINNVKVGRCDLKISAISYQNTILKEVLVVSGKRKQLNIKMSEEITSLEEVVITPGNSFEMNNEMVLISGQEFDASLTERFAGSRNDPARMVSNFAGVSGANDGRNDIIIRGNSPMGVLWRLEDIDIPSPNHFSSFGSTGGPVGMINSNTLGNSDFITSAFPASYGNSTSGVFDLSLRNGNIGKKEFMGQIGFNGFELGSEGSFTNNGSATYLINYRYSTLGLFNELGIGFGTGKAIPKYQDLTTKINLPTKKIGKFSLFFLGGNSSTDILGSEIDFQEDSDDLYGNENQDIYNRSQTRVVGLSHTVFFTPTLYGKLIMAYTHTKTTNDVDSVMWRNDIPNTADQANIYNKEDKFIGHYYINKKFSTKNTIKSGIILTAAKSEFEDSVYIHEHNIWHINRKGDDENTLMQLYTDWLFKISPKWHLKSGIHTSFYSRNSEFIIEPRFNIKYLVNTKVALNMGLGLHSQAQALPILFSQQDYMTPNLENNNLKLEATKSEHFVIGIDYRINNVLRFKSEAYYQNLSNVPVDSYPSSFSTLNLGAEFNLPTKPNLVNNGIGRNYGIELSLERSFNKGIYFMLNSSIFKSEYQGSDKVWRNTAFNNQYIINGLFGKEWQINHKLSFTFDTKAVISGGRFYTPIDLNESIKNGFEVLDESRIYKEQMKTYFRWDLKIGAKLNLLKMTHEWTIDFQNLTNRENDYSYHYNNRTKSINTVTQLGLYIIPQYRIYF